MTHCRLVQHMLLTAALFMAIYKFSYTRTTCPWFLQTSFICILMFWSCIPHSPFNLSRGLPMAHHSSPHIFSHTHPCSFITLSSLYGNFLKGRPSSQHLNQNPTFILFLILNWFWVLFQEMIHKKILNECFMWIGKHGVMLKYSCGIKS